MLEAGNKGIAASFYGHGKLAFRMEFSGIDSSYNYLLCISEAETERILRERLASQGVAIEWGVTLTAFAQADLTGSLGFQLVIQGRASAALLETYGEERLPVIRDVLTRTEGLTDAVAEEDRSFYDQMASTDLRTQSAIRISQISVNYTESPLSANQANPGELRAGMRVPDISLMVRNKPQSAEQEPHSARMFSLLDPSKFTLLYVNVAVPGALHAGVEANLAPWRDLIESYQISPVEASVEHEHFTDKLGNSPSIILVRPDSYIGFIGDENSVPQLTEYLAKWMTSGP
jgi:hypothetical protein